MKTLIDHLSTYATYHRHVRNIATHFVGIPVIVVSVAGLLARASLDVGGLPLSLAIVAWLLISAFYLRLDARYGLSMTALVGLAVWAGHGLAALSLSSWLGASLGLFVVGWVIQFVGHYYEGRKPAFVDDIMGLAVGPLFVVAEVGFLMGLRPEVQQQVEQIAGPVRATPAGQVQTSH